VAAGVLLFAAFVWLERRRGERAMMPLALFGSADFVGLTLLTVLLYGAFGGVLVLLPYMLMETAGYSATRAGAALLPLALIMAAASPLTGALAGRIGPRPSLLAGPIIVGAGFLLATRIGPDARFWTEVLPAVAVMALGMAAAAAPLTTAVLGAVDARHTGSASGFNSAAARGGGLAATALLGHALATHGADLLHQFRLAAVIAAGACLAASASLLLLHGRSAPPKTPKG
jgi:predicted MFS family arabinose efflux permease